MSSPARLPSPKSRSTPALAEAPAARSRDQLDADLRPYYAPPEHLARTGFGDMNLALLVVRNRNERVLAEQSRRDALRTEYAQAEQAASAQLARIGQQQQEAEAARTAEASRQSAMQRQIERARAEQQRAIDQERVATDAIAMSGMVPATGGTAPTAQTGRSRRGRGRGRTTAGAQGIRIDGSRQLPGVGLNIGV